VEDRIEYFERMLADNPDNPTGLLALANEYNKVGRHEDEAEVLERYVTSHERERTDRQRPLWIRFSASLTGGSSEKLELLRA
jgi:thioredoxin-like negative regulator of GroEL